MTSSEEQKCRDCDFKAPVEEWEFVIEGRRNILCVECSFRYCAREWCSFKAPLKTWKIKSRGVPGKWCERCCDVARQRQLNKSEEVKEDDKARDKARCSTEAFREKANEKGRLRNSVLVTCPDCKKEMQPGSLPKHLNHRRCKGKPAEVYPLVESTIVSVD